MQWKNILISSIDVNLVKEELESEVIGCLYYCLICTNDMLTTYILFLPVDKLDDTHNAFNSFHPRFTVDKPQNCSICFQDIQLKYETDKIESDWFTKSVLYQRYLNFNLNTPINYKNSVVINLIDRAIRIAHGKYVPKNMKVVKNYKRKWLSKHILWLNHKKNVSVNFITFTTQRTFEIYLLENLNLLNDVFILWLSII